MPDIIRTRANWKRAKASTDPDDYCSLGLTYLCGGGPGTKINVAEGLAYLKKAYDAGDPLGSFLYPVFFHKYSRDDNKKEETQRLISARKEIFLSFWRLVEAKDSWALYVVGYLYKNKLKKDRPFDLENNKIAQGYLKSANDTSNSPMFQLGYIMHAEHHLKIIRAKHVNYYYEKSARQGNPQAQFALGWDHMQSARGKSYLKAAADQGNPRAQYWLYRMRMESSLKYLQASAEQGHHSAVNEMRCEEGGIPPHYIDYYNHLRQSGFNYSLCGAYKRGQHPDCKGKREPERNVAGSYSWLHESLIYHKPPIDRIIKKPPEKQPGTLLISLYYLLDKKLEEGEVEPKQKKAVFNWLARAEVLLQNRLDPKKLSLQSRIRVANHYYGRALHVYSAAQVYNKEEEKIEKRIAFYRDNLNEAAFKKEALEALRFFLVDDAGDWFKALENDEWSCSHAAFLITLLCSLEGKATYNDDQESALESIMPEEKKQDENDKGLDDDEENKNRLTLNLESGMNNLRDAEYLKYVGLTELKSFVKDTGILSKLETQAERKAQLAHNQLKAVRNMLADTEKQSQTYNNTLNGLERFFHAIGDFFRWLWSGYTNRISRGGKEIFTTNALKEAHLDLRIMRLRLMLANHEWSDKYDKDNPIPDTDLSEFDSVIDVDRLHAIERLLKPEEKPLPELEEEKAPAQSGNVSAGSENVSPNRIEQAPNHPNNIDSGTGKEVIPKK